nr:MAG TPA: hypothetical protein [Caudoviricetes sp.]
MINWCFIGFYLWVNLLNSGAKVLQVLRRGKSAYKHCTNSVQLLYWFCTTIV